MIQDNYNRIRAEVRQIVADELQRIQSDPELQYLLQRIFQTVLRIFLFYNAYF